MKYMFQFAIVGMLLLLGGCGESSNDKGVSAGNYSRIEGIVTDRDGPITSGKVIIKDKNGAAITSATLNEDSRYSVDIPANTAYPVVLEIEGHDELLEAVVLDPTAVKQDITPMSSLVVRSARDLGGVTKENMARAAINAISQSKTASGKNTTAGFKGDPTKQYGGWH
ncbi:hypothetical protein [Methylobacter sp. YRD-M1]|uniref:hypothetical protein n=1 Tax=Methylobacter sp. YRD-M1 TaxID=2911520 RepID=UPI00227D1439|nr:hypothetical protein [Methylobacter sp. YRD-M1]WAK00774.1 hypothetical protein LZ558_13070 [Methylobacter sp. YRD-M1]